MLVGDYDGAFSAPPRVTSKEAFERLARSLAARRVPQFLRSDNGSEFNAEAARNGLAKVGVKTLYVEPGGTWEIGCVKLFIGKLRDGVMDRDMLYMLSEARVLIDRWRHHRKRVRPRSASGD